MNTVTLSKRMQALADLVDEGSILCDVGCDHGYLPIWLLEQRIIRHACAMDINQGPLDRASENIRIAVSKGSIPADSIELRLSNGLEKLKEGEADTILIAGMGGNLVLDILKAKPNLASSMHALILQPQSDIGLVRGWLLEEGYEFITEDMVEEDGKYYPMMKVRYNPDRTSDRIRWKPSQIRYGKLLIEQKHLVLIEYLRREKRIKGDILDRLNKQSANDERIAARKQEVMASIEEIQNILAEMGHNDNSCNR